MPESEETLREREGSRAHHNENIRRRMRTNYHQGFLDGRDGTNSDCDRCKGKIAMTDVQGHYSGECAHCRGVE
jgi:hypothetical protein